MKVCLNEFLRRLKAVDKGFISTLILDSREQTDQTIKKGTYWVRLDPTEPEKLSDKYSERIQVKNIKEGPWVRWYIYPTVSSMNLTGIFCEVEGIANVRLTLRIEGSRGGQE